MDIFQEENYRNKQIEVIATDETLELRIDGKKIAVTADLNGESFASPLRPYRTYPDLVSLGKAIIRSRSWSGVAHEVTP